MNKNIKYSLFIIFYLLKIGICLICAIINSYYQGILEIVFPIQDSSLKPLELVSF